MSHPPKQLTLTPAVHTCPSGQSRLPVRTEFRNQHSSEVTVYNIKPSGARARGVRLATGKSVTYNVGIGGVVVIERKDGTIHELHSPSWPPKTITISSE